MVSLTFDVDDKPLWALGYFRAFDKWKINDAPRELPAGYTSWIDLFCDQHNIKRIDVRPIANKQQSKLVSMTFSWESEEDKTLFMLKFS